MLAILNGARDITPRVKCLPNIHEALCSTPRTKQNTKHQPKQNTLNKRQNRSQFKYAQKPSGTLLQE